MRYVLMNWVHPDDAEAWERSSAEDQQADVERHLAWFRKHGEHVVGGEELDTPRTVKTLRAPAGRARESWSPTARTWRPRRSWGAS